MRILLTGASGFLGRRLMRVLLRRGDQILAVTRSASSLALGQLDLGDTSARIQLIEADPTQAGAWQRQIEGCDAVISLAGEPVLGARWTQDFRQRARRSRIESVRRLVEGMLTLPDEQRPKVLLSASAVGYYGPTSLQGVDESAPPGSDFLAQLCVDWEAATQPAADRGVRVVLARIGVVLGRGGGALEQFLPAFRLFLGGPLGGGDQFVPWVHEDDVMGLALLALSHTAATGPMNWVAPHPATMRELTRELGRVLHRPARVPVPAFVLRAALGERAQVILDSQRIVPAAALRLGYTFQHPELAEALTSLNLTL